MTPQAIRSEYRRIMARFVAEPVLIRRYTGTGANRLKHDYGPIDARAMGFRPEELVGSIQQGDVGLVLLAEDVEAAQIGLPLLKTDKVVIRGREAQIEALDDNTRRVRDTLIAYEIRVRG